MAQTSRSASAAAHVIRVFIAEDHRITLWGLQRLIDASHPRMRVIGTATTRQELLNHDAVAEADIVVLDLDLAGEDSVASLRDVQRRCPGQILILTGADDTSQHRAAVIQGARGVVHKSQSADIILHAIEKVHEGQVWLDRGLMAEVLGQLTGAPRAPRPEDIHAQRIASLTPRERDIVRQLTHQSGAKLLSIAADLGLSENTLRNHLTTIYSKLEVRGRLELHVYATAHGLGATENGSIRSGRA